MPQETLFVPFGDAKVGIKNCVKRRFPQLLKSSSFSTQVNEKLLINYSKSSIISAFTTSQNVSQSSACGL